MPTLRLDEVKLENPDQVANLPPNLKKIFDDLANINAPLTKLDDKTVLDLRAIAEALKISVFDLFSSNEKLYRLKIIEELSKKFPDQKSDENLIEGLHKEILKSINDFPVSILIFYATQSLPKSILENQEYVQKYIEPICKALGNVAHSSLEEEVNTNGLTLDSFILSKVYELKISIDDISSLTRIPISLLVWLKAPPKQPRNSIVATLHSSEWLCNYCQQTGNVIACWLC